MQTKLNYEHIAWCAQYYSNASLYHKGKTNEIILSLLTEAPHLICVTEHHLKNYEIDATLISNYKLGAKYCRKKLKNGGVCIYKVSQEECARLREGVPYVKVYRYNPKHLCPKLNGYGDNGQRSLKL